MKIKSLTYLFITLLFVACKNHKQVQKIEKFIWIENNGNRVNSPSDLKVITYLEYTDSIDKIRISRTTSLSTKHYEAVAPDSVKIYIFQLLYKKKFPVCCSSDENKTVIYDGNYFSVIYQFEGDSEKIINFYPFQLPDSLRKCTKYFESISYSKNFSTTDSFDTYKYLKKYNQKILQCMPELHEDSTVKFMPPQVNETSE